MICHRIFKYSAHTKGSFEKSVKRKSNNTSDALHQAVTSLKHLLQQPVQPMTEYARHVTAQLHRLLLVNAVRLQERIQKLITEERISCVTRAANSDYNRQVQQAAPPQMRCPAYSVSEPHSASSYVAYSS
jgi:hypothetical protein